MAKFVDHCIVTGSSELSLPGDVILTSSIENLIKQAQEKNLSLSELRDRLLTHQQDLNQTSVELFNNSYDRFFKLSHLISCLSSPLEHIIKPIEIYHKQLDELCRQHDAYLAQIDLKIAQLEEINKNKEIACILIKLIKRRDRILDQINQLDWLKRQRSFESIIQESDNQDIEHKISCDRIERLTVELHYLYCEISAIQPTNDELIPIKQSLETSVREQREQLNSWFRALFHEALHDQSKKMIDFVLITFRQIGDEYYHNLDLQKYFRGKLSTALASIDNCLAQQPLSEIPYSANSGDDNLQFKIKICSHIYQEVIQCWSPEFYIEQLDSHFTKIACSILEKFALWLGKLRLSDFRITGPTTATTVGGSRSTTNFLAKQDAIMRLLIDDCTRLIDLIDTYERNTLPKLDSKQSEMRQSSLQKSSNIVKDGLNNVRSLQNLLER